jgi:hypothetical protein
MATNVTLEQVREFIRFADKNQLEHVSDIIQSRWKHLQAETAMTFKRDDKVSYEGRKKEGYRRIHGVVVAVDGKWVYVRTDRFIPGFHRGEWDIKVAPTLLRKEG